MKKSILEKMALIFILLVIVVSISIAAIAQPTEDEIKDYLAEAVKGNNEFNLPDSLSKEQIKEQIKINKVRPLKNDSLSIVDVEINSKPVKLLTTSILGKVQPSYQDLVGLIKSNANVTGILYYNIFQANTYHFFASDLPEPVCMKANNNRYVGCKPVVVSQITEEENGSVKYSYQMSCDETPECTRKAAEFGAEKILKSSQDKEERLSQLQNIISELGKYDEIYSALINLTGVDADKTIPVENSPNVLESQNTASQNLGIQRINGSVVIKLG